MAKNYKARILRVFAFEPSTATDAHNHKRTLASVCMHTHTHTHTIAHTTYAHTRKI
jgi:hypothetical protein